MKNWLLDAQNSIEHGEWNLKTTSSVDKKCNLTINEDTEEIEIKGITESLCETIKLKEKSSSEKTSESIATTSETLEETQRQPITSSVLYQSSDIKARNVGVYFFCAVLLLLILL